MPTKKLFIYTLLLVFALVGTVSSISAQHRLKMTKVKMCYWNDYLEKWSSWPSDWTYFSSGEEPVVKFTRLDNGSRFLVETWINGDYTSFRVTYTGYDPRNEWYEYEDANGDEVNVRNATMSDLARYGWPRGKTVEIYFWIYSEDFAMVLI